MKFELKLDKEQLTEIGKGAGKIGKAIIVEGTKAVALKGAEAAIRQSFDGGLGSVTDLKLDDVLKGGKKKNVAPKKALFSFRKKKDKTGETLETEIGLDTEVTDLEFEEVGEEPAEEKTIEVKPAAKKK